MPISNAGIQSLRAQFTELTNIEQRTQFQILVSMAFRPNQSGFSIADLAAVLEHGFNIQDAVPLITEILTSFELNQLIQAMNERAAKELSKYDNSFKRGNSLLTKLESHEIQSIDSQFVLEIYREIEQGMVPLIQEYQFQDLAGFNAATECHEQLIGILLAYMMKLMERAKDFHNRIKHNCHQQFILLKEKLGEQDRALILVGGYLFLRYICPLLVVSISKSSYDELIKKILMVVMAKSLQKLANDTLVKDGVKVEADLERWQQSFGVHEIELKKIMSQLVLAVALAAIPNEQTDIDVFSRKRQKINKKVFVFDEDSFDKATPKKQPQPKLANVVLDENLPNCILNFDLNAVKVLLAPSIQQGILDKRVSKYLVQAFQVFQTVAISKVMPQSNPQVLDRKIMELLTGLMVNRNYALNLTDEDLNAMRDHYFSMLSNATEEQQEVGPNAERAWQIVEVLLVYHILSITSIGALNEQEIGGILKLPKNSGIGLCAHQLRLAVIDIDDVQSKKYFNTALAEDANFVRHFLTKLVKEFLPALPLLDELATVETLEEYFLQHIVGFVRRQVPQATMPAKVPPNNLPSEHYEKLPKFPKAPASVAPKTAFLQPPLQPNPQPTADLNQVVYLPFPPSPA